MKKYIELSNVYRTYKNGKLRNNVLNKVNLVINKGEIILDDRIVPKTTAKVIGSNNSPPG